ncbi:protein UXT [Ixodes scapularis]|uniref:protein UXT n=1 Tax=Ixodes scapularis TaxID=6945 RepID=UPI001C388204|nr:protein UXT [Ixodes scapularis]
MADVRAKVLQYETFLNEVLKEDLRRCLEEREKVCSKLSELLQLRTIIERIQEVQKNEETFRTQVDLGCNFYVQAVVPDPSKVCVQVGLGFFVELTHEEALWFVGRREVVLEQDLKRLSEDSANIKAHIQMTLQCLRELQGLPVETDPPKRRDVF